VRTLYRNGSGRKLTQLVDAAPEGDQWLHEIKYDGYRMHARLDHGQMKLLTRTGLDWTHKYPAIADAVASLDARQAYLDGELCGVGPDGITSFSIVQLASDSGNAAALVFSCTFIERPTWSRPAESLPSARVFGGSVQLRQAELPLARVRV
jgi:hypothetical protein